MVPRRRRRVVTDGGSQMEPDKPIVYVVEDSPILLRLLTELIEANGATVVGHADTAPAAIEEIAELHPDAVTIDITLRKGTGFDVLEAMAIGYEKPPLRIVV